MLEMLLILLVLFSAGINLWEVFERRKRTAALEESLAQVVTSIVEMQYAQNDNIKHILRLVRDTIH